MKVIQQSTTFAVETQKTEFQESMTTQMSRLKSLGYSIGLVSTLFILSQCISPMANPFSRWIASQSVHIMFIYFSLGGIALVRRQPYLVLFCWTITMSLCHFLKDGTSSPFYYSPTSIHQAGIQVAHFDLETVASQDAIFKQLSNLDADLISIQSFSNKKFERRLIKSLEFCYPYQHLLHYQDQKARTSYVFSKLPLEEIDSFHCEGIPYISGFLKMDSSSHQRVQFVSLHIPAEIKADPANILNRLDALADKCALHKSKGEAFLAFSAIPMASWSPEIRSFRTRFTLNDSRLDIDWEGSFEHVFYSDQLRCTSFETISNGVIGHYQFSPQHLALNKGQINLSDKALSER